MIQNPVTDSDIQKEKLPTAEHASINYYKIIKQDSSVSEPEVSRSVSMRNDPKREPKCIRRTENKAAIVWIWPFHTSETDPQSTFCSVLVHSSIFPLPKIPSEDIYTSDSDLFPLSGPWVAMGRRTKDKSALFFLTGSSRTEQHLSWLIYYPPLHLAWPGHHTSSFGPFTGPERTLELNHA